MQSEKADVQEVGCYAAEDQEHIQHSNTWINHVSWSWISQNEVVEL